MSRRFEPGFDRQSRGPRREEHFPPPDYAQTREAPPAPQPPYYPPSAYGHHPPPDPRAYWPAEPLHGQWADPRYRDANRYPGYPHDSYAPPPLLPPHYHDSTLRGPPTQPGYQQAHLSQPFSANPFPQTYGPRTRRRPKEQARAACSNCKRDHVSCDNSRPCRRCVNAGKESTCEDVPPKKRGRPKVRPDPATFQPLPQSSTAPERTSQRAADQTVIPNRDEPEGTGFSTADPLARQAKYPPSSWMPPRGQFSPPKSAHTTAGSRPNTVAGSQPSPPQHTRTAPSNLSPIYPPSLPEISQSRAGAPLPTPPSASSPHSYQYSSSAISLPPTDRFVVSPARPDQPQAAYPLVAVPSARYGPEVPPPPPPHNPPIPQRSPASQPGPQLPPLTALQHGYHSPERRPTAAGETMPVYDFSPAIPRRQPDHAVSRSHRYSWHEPRSAVGLTRRPMSHGEPSRRRSMDARPQPRETGIVERVAPDEESYITGQRRPSMGEGGDDGPRKRQRLTLNEIMRSD